jgi:hypothetical protein
MTDGEREELISDNHHDYAGQKKYTHHYVIQRDLRSVTVLDFSEVTSMKMMMSKLMNMEGEISFVQPLPSTSCNGLGNQEPLNKPYSLRRSKANRNSRNTSLNCQLKTSIFPSGVLATMQLQLSCRT